MFLDLSLPYKVDCSLGCFYSKQSKRVWSCYFLVASFVKINFIGIFRLCQAHLQYLKYHRQKRDGVNDNLF